MCFRRSAPGESLARRSLVILYILTTFFFLLMYHPNSSDHGNLLDCFGNASLFSFFSSLLISATIYRFSGAAIFYSFYNRRFIIIVFLLSSSVSFFNRYSHHLSSTSFIISVFLFSFLKGFSIATLVIFVS